LQLSKFEWVNPVIIYNGSLASFYLNGNLVSSFASPLYSLVYAQPPITFGAYTNHASSLFYWGSLDDIRFYDRVLTRAEINALYSEPNPLPTTPQTFVPTTAPSATSVPTTAPPATSVPTTVIPATTHPTSTVPATASPTTTVPATPSASVTTTVIPPTAAPNTTNPETASTISPSAVASETSGGTFHPVIVAGVCGVALLFVILLLVIPSTRLLLISCCEKICGCGMNCFVDTVRLSFMIFAFSFAVEPEPDKMSSITPQVTTSSATLPYPPPPQTPPPSAPPACP
jgi:hypothetical protein